MVNANVTVRVREDESFERALRRFNKMCEKLGVKRDILKNLRYDNPSTIKNRQRNLIRRKMQRAKKENQ